MRDALLTETITPLRWRTVQHRILRKPGWLLTVT